MDRKKSFSPIIRNDKLVFNAIIKLSEIINGDETDQDKLQKIINYLEDLRIKYGYTIDYDDYLEALFSKSEKRRN